MASKTREPIISVLGHVDSGKTSLLDHIRGSVVASREAGGITQHIGATDVPFEVVKDICGPLLEKIKLKIQVRGLLFIGTPGHEAFITLRKRGGSVADIAILIVDLRDGLMPQSIEAIEILRQYKTPFLVAANKVDTISGWQKNTQPEKQNQTVRDEFYKKFYKLVGQLSEYGFDSDLYTQVTDFGKQIAIVPVSAKTGEGIPQLMMMLMGLTQTYLAKELSVELSSPGKGTVLEVKEERGLGTTIDAIIYDGIIRRGDTIVVGAKGEPIVTKVKALLRPHALDEMRDPKEKFKNVDEVYAAYGVKIAAPGLENALSGAPVYVGGEELVAKVKEEIGEIEFTKDILGVVVKADTLGSLEALVKILSDKSIPVKRGGIGRVSKQDVIEASAVASDNMLLGAILAFNAPVSEDISFFAEDQGAKIIKSKIVYQIIDDYLAWAEEEKDKAKRKREKTVSYPVKFRILPDHVFRTSKPAIVGVEILAGMLFPGVRLLLPGGKVKGMVRGIQSGGDSVEKAVSGEKVAVSIDDVSVGRHIHEDDVIYSFISIEDLEELKKGELSDEEKKVLREMREVKRSEHD
ncbi:MAG: translation initiation factor IF-2 [Candidatus Altiarchaeota archaeon]